MKKAYVQGVGVLAPGLVGWQQCREVLTGKQPYEPAELPKLVPQRLAAAVRRRTGDYIRLAIEVASEAVDNSDVDPSTLASVFCTSDGDGQIAHNICEAVTHDEPMVSPTQFHNSVANAPAGYWSQAVQSFEPSTSVAGFDHAFAVGMIEAMAQVTMEDRPILLVSHDVRFPEPLHSARPMASSFGVAMVLSPEKTNASLCALTATIHRVSGKPSVFEDAALETVRKGNPAARSLAALQAIANGSGTVELNYPEEDLLRLEFAS